MKLRQNLRHFAAKQALTMPVVGEKMNERLVDLHVGVFGDRAEEGAREEREPHMEAFFDCTMETYLAALSDGYPEAEAREITHLQANFDFYNHGWTEMMEFPVDEVEEHYDRYEEFFRSHGITIDDPLGEFRDREVPEAPSTPGKLDDPDHPHAAAGFADDVYVETDEGVVAGDRSDEIQESAD